MPQINLNIKVLRATGLACNGKIGRLPNGNVKISLNDDSELKKACRRNVVKRTTSPTQDKSFQFCFDSTDSTVAFELVDEAPEPSISYGVVEKTLYDVLTRNRLDIIFPSCDATLSVQADIESQSTVLYALIEVAKSLDKLMEIAESTVELHPYITVACTAVSSVCKSVKGQLDGDEEIRSLLRAITSLYKFTAPLEAAYGNGQDLDGTLVEVIRQILRQTIGCVLFIQEYSGHGFASRSISDISSPAGRKIKEFIDVFAGLGTSLALQNALNPTAMDWSGRPTCHPSTRHEDHRRITEWIVEPPTRSQSKVLWITGPPGVGKSTFATTVAKTYAELGRLGAFVFFDRDVQERSSPLSFVRTLAYELSRFDARIAREVENAVKQSPHIAQAGLDGQFRELVKKPLHCAASDMSERGSLGDDGPVVIVIDALDECGNESNRKQLLELLGRETSQLPLVLRVIIASRPEPDMLVEIHKRPNIDHNEL